MLLECDLDLECQGHRYRLVSRPTTTGRPAFDLSMAGMVDLLSLARQANKLNSLAASYLPKRLCEVHVWVGSRQLASVEVPR
jgi:hypothetical protein